MKSRKKRKKKGCDVSDFYNNSLHNDVVTVSKITIDERKIMPSTNTKCEEDEIFKRGK